jgi:hypothetical protein
LMAVARRFTSTVAPSALNGLISNCLSRTKPTVARTCPQNVCF